MRSGEEEGDRFPVLNSTTLRPQIPLGLRVGFERPVGRYSGDSSNGARRNKD